MDHLLGVEYTLLAPYTCPCCIMEDDIIAEGFLTEIAPKYMEEIIRCVERDVSGQRLKMQSYDKDNKYGWDSDRVDFCIEKVDYPEMVYLDVDKYETVVDHDEMMRHFDAIKHPEIMQNYIDACEKIKEFNNFEFPRWRELFSQNEHPGRHQREAREAESRKFMNDYNAKRHAEIMASEWDKSYLVTDAFGLYR